MARKERNKASDRKSEPEVGNEAAEANSNPSSVEKQIADEKAIKLILEKLESILGTDSANSISVIEISEEFVSESDSSDSNSHFEQVESYNKKNTKDSKWFLAGKGRSSEQRSPS